MKVVRLTPKHADEIAELEQKVYAPKFQHGHETIRANLLKSEDESGNLSWGLLENDRLVGYITAWVDESHVKEYIQEDVIFIDDIVIIPDYRSGLYKILKAFSKSLMKEGKWGLPIESIARRNAYELYTKHRELLEKFGYELAYTYEYQDESHNELLIWVRFENARS